VLRRIFGPKRGEVTGDRRKLLEEKLHHLSYSAPNIITKIKSSIMRWVGHIRRIGIWEIGTKFRLESLKGGDHSEDLDVDGRTIIKFNLRKYNKKVWSGLI
jgi:hypothetical protein